MKRALLTVTLALACMGGVSAQDKPNFAGKWKADASFTVYMLDGTPSKNPLDGGMGEIVMTSTWDGPVLVTTITAPQMTRIERRSIEAACATRRPRADGVEEDRVVTAREAVQSASAARCAVRWP